MAGESKSRYDQPPNTLFWGGVIVGEIGRRMAPAVFLGIALFAAGCMTAEQHQAAVANADKDRLTVGTVQKEIRVGMSGDEVVSTLGAPNIVTTDDQRRESWVYDKISTDRVYSTSSGGVGIIFLAGVNQSAGARSTTQRSLTVIIKFDANKKVRDFAYRQSSF